MFPLEVFKVPVPVPVPYPVPTVTYLIARGSKVFIINGSMYGCVCLPDMALSLLPLLTNSYLGLSGQTESTMIWNVAGTTVSPNK